MRILARIHRVVKGVVSGRVRYLEEKGNYTLLTSCSSVQDFLAILIAFWGSCAKCLYFFSVAFIKATTINGPLKLQNDISSSLINLGDCRSRSEWCKLFTSRACQVGNFPDESTPT
jgi:hypothetical protein